MAGDVVTRENLNQLPATTVGNCYYEIQPFTMREGFGPSVSWTAVRCRIDAARRFDWRTAMVGRVRVARSIGSASTPVLSRLIPETVKWGRPVDPLSPDRPPGLQYCTGAEHVLAAGLNAAGTLQTAATRWPETAGFYYDVRFEAFPYNVWDDTKTYAFAAYATATATGSPTVAPELFRYVIRDRKMTLREQPLPLGGPSAGYRIVDDATPANRKVVGVGKVNVVYEDVSYTWVRIPRGWPPPVAYALPAAGRLWPPATDLNPKAVNPDSVLYVRDEYVGRVNDDWFDHLDVRGYAFAPGELRYDGYQTAEYVDAAGDEVMDCTFFFKRKKGGWNKFLTADGSYAAVSQDGLSTGTKLYPEGDLNLLFSYAGSI